MEEEGLSDSKDQILDTFNIHFLSQSNSAYKEMLGVGGGGSVYAAVYRGNAVAIKLFKPNTEERVIKKEIEMMKLLKGEYHVVQYIGRYMEPAGDNMSVCLVMEVAYSFTLAELLTMTGCDDFSRELRIRLARDVCQGVRALHNRGIAHEDIKTDNVLLNFGLRAKLCDFGCARFVTEVDYPPLSGTKHKKAPEKERGGPYHRLRSDIFSLGLVLEEILQTKEFGALVSQCKSQDSDERPTCDEILDALPVLEVGYAGFTSVNHTLEHLEETDKFNISYHWTEFDPEEDPELTQGRHLFYKGLYDDAFEFFSFCEEPVADVFLGIMTFHGFGPGERDVEAALALFEKSLEKDEFEDRALVRSLIQYYIAMGLLSRGRIDDLCKERAHRYLQKIDERGSSLGPTQLANMHSQTFLTYEPGLNKRMSIRYLFKAVKAGYSRAEAFLTLSYIYCNQKLTIPSKELEYLVKSVEGGCVLGKVLLDFVTNNINEEEVLQTDNHELLFFLGFLYYTIGRTHLSKYWFSKASKSDESEEGIMIAMLFDDQRDLERALDWQLKSKEASSPSASSQDFLGQFDDSFTFSILPSWRHRLAEKYLQQGKLDEAQKIILNTPIDSYYDLQSLIAFACNSPEARTLLREVRYSLKDTTVFYVAHVFCQRGLRDDAVDWLEDGVRKGDVEAMSSLGSVFYAEANFCKAKALYKEAAEAGSASALMNLGVMEREENDFHRALQHLESAVSHKAAIPAAMAELAQTLLEVDADTNLPRAKQLLERCIEQGCESRVWSLIRLLKGDEQQYWFDRALRNVEFEVLVQLGISSEDTSTVELLDISANRGTAQALYNKGMYLYSISDDEEEEAYRLFAMAAKQGHIDAISICIIMCADNDDAEHVDQWETLLRTKHGHRSPLSMK